MNKFVRKAETVILWMLFGTPLALICFVAGGYTSVVLFDEKHVLSMALVGLGVGIILNAVFPLCLMLIEQPDRSAIRAKTRHDLLVPLTSLAFLNASYHCGLEHEVSEPANKNYNCTL